MLVELGLALIGIGWIVQLVYALKKKKEIQMWFMVAYLIGVLLLVISGFQAGLSTVYYELVTFVLALLVLLVYLFKK